MGAPKNRNVSAGKEWNDSEGVEQWVYRIDGGARSVYAFKRMELFALASARFGKGVLPLPRMSTDDIRAALSLPDGQVPDVSHLPEPTPRPERAPKAEPAPKAQYEVEPGAWMPEHKHHCFDTVAKLVKAGLNVYLVGPAGTGKTTLASQVARHLGKEFGTISCHAQMTGSSLAGFMNATGEFVETEFHRMFTADGVFLLDEIDNGNPNILAWANQALANRRASFANGTVDAHEGFRFIGAANTYGTGATREYIGRQALDAATLDRFVMVEVDYDTAYEAKAAVKVAGPMGKLWAQRIWHYRKNATKHGVKIVLSTRAIVDGATMLAQGFTVPQVLDMRVFRGINPDQVTKLREGDAKFDRPGPEPEPEHEASPVENKSLPDRKRLASAWDTKCTHCKSPVAKHAPVYWRGKGDCICSTCYTLHGNDKIGE